MRNSTLISVELKRFDEIVAKRPQTASVEHELVLNTAEVFNSHILVVSVFAALPLMSPQG